MNQKTDEEREPNWYIMDEFGKFTFLFLPKQMKKLFEEVDEFDVEICKGDFEKAKNELGDIIVVCTILAKMLDSDMQECLNLAYNKISKRTGMMVDGTFVKDKY